MKKFKKLNLRKLSVAKLENKQSVKGGTDERSVYICAGTKTRTMCTDPCGGQLSIEDAACG
ncbi:hypothetical protein [uncultured Kordia sp.]|uniref:hypothetical protein n=1 Tax=uncultured Kordia sp. TaxID=507699 RepID=UPI002622664B|nr:hypothetical protein [uncultured Kordia sp.]